MKAPRVNDKLIDPDTVERQRFSSTILPAWARKSPQMAEVLPLLYLHGRPAIGYGAKYPEAPKIVDDAEVLLEF